ncbi:Pentaxin, partial [Candidatus Magnetomorum sp. HK-1]
MNTFLSLIANYLSINKTGTLLSINKLLYLVILVFYIFITSPAIAETNYALTFDGSNDYVNVGSVPLANKSFTIECWAKRDTSDNWDIIFGLGTNSNNNNLHVGFRSSNEFTMGFGANDVNTSATYTDTDWHHWAVSYDINTMTQKIYRDGIEVASRIAGAHFGGSGDAIIGRYATSNEHFFDGQIDELRIWDTPRTQTQIQEYMYRTLSPEDETALLAYYKFNQSSGYSLFDSSGNDYHGTLVNLDENTAWVTSTATVQDNPDIIPLEKALLFDGTNDYVNAGSGIYLANKSFTIEFWATRNSTNDYDLIFSLGTSSANNNLHMGFRSTNTFTLAFYSNDLNTSATYGVEGWHHWAGTYDASTNKRIIYRDGDIVASDTASSDFVGNGSIILGRNVGNEHYHNGAMDEFRVWNTVRSQAQIRENMYQTISEPESYTSLLAYYQFNHSSGTTLDDISGNNNTGTLTDMDAINAWIPFSAPLQDNYSAPKNALAFDGSNDRVNIGNINLANQSFSIEFWTKHTISNTFNMVLFLGTVSTNAGLHVGFRANNIFTIDFMANALETTQAYTDKDWHHWAVTFDSGTKARVIYRDGVAVASDTSASNFIGTGDILIGHYLPDNIYYTGEIDEFRIWSTARTSSQVKEYMNKTLVGNETGLLAYYRFDQQSTSLIIDHSGNKDHGSMENMDPFSAWVNSSANIHAHNGPGGIGGTNGLSHLNVWLKADSLTGLNHGDPVSIWSDNSGNSNAVSQTQTANQPQFQYSQVNGKPAISFSGYPNSTGGSDFDYLNMGIEDLSPGTPLSIYVVGKIDSSGDHTFFGRSNPLCRFSNTSFESHRNTYTNTYNTDSSTPGSFSMMSMMADNTQAMIKWNGAQKGNAYTLTNSDFIESGELWIGALESNGYSSLDGAIAEMIIYDYTLNLAQQTILDNYLSSKYDISIASDKYAGDQSSEGDYDHDVAGIGKEADGTHTLARSSGMVLRDNAFLTDNGDYVLMGHSDTNDISFTNNSSDLPSTVRKRLSRIWYMDRTDENGSANGNILIGFDFNDAGLSEIIDAPDNYSLLYRSGTDGTFSTAQSITVYTIDDCIYFEISESVLNDGYYTLGWKSLPGAGNALSFDGSNDYVEVPYNQNLNTDVFTVSIWAKVTGGSGRYRSVFTSRKDGYYGYLIYAEDTNNWSFWYGSGSTWVQLDGSAVVLNQWTHLAMTCDGNRVIAYINGVQIGQNTGFSKNTSRPLRIGTGSTENTTPDLYFPGDLDEFRYYNVVLSQEEIREVMCKKLSQNNGNLVAYYRFDQTSGLTLPDLSGNAFHAPLINMDDSDWVLSGAPIGDVSAYDYNGSSASDFVASLTHSDGDAFTAVGYGGTFQGIHLYRIDESPSVTTPPASFESMLTTHYWGVFTVGSSPTYSITYDYGSNAFTDENSVQLAYRENNADSDWSSLWTIQNKESNLLSFYGMSTSDGYLGSEFIFGIEPVNYTSGDLIAYYPFNGNANDESGNGNDGTLYGAKLTTDRNGYKKSAFSFNGTDEWIELTDFGVPETFSVALWLNIGSATNQAYLGKDSSANSNFFILGGYNGNKIEVNIRDNVNNGGSQTTGYHFLTAVIEKLTSSSSQVTMYLDETICWQNTYNTVVGSFSPGKAWTVGQEWNGSSVNSLFTGTIDEISFFNRALNPAEVRYLYQRPISISTIESPAIVSDTVSFTVTTEESSQITITVHSSNQSAISDSNINLASSGSNQLTLNTTASIPVNLTLTLTPESTIYTRVTITCSISKAGRLTESVSFPVILSPPGSGNALDFDGTDDYIDLPDNVWFYNDFTVEAWVYYRSYGTWDRLIDIGAGEASNNIIIALSNSSQYLTFQIYNGNSGTEVISPEKVPLNQWVHIAVTSSGSVGNIYINGRLVATNSSMNQAYNVSRSNAYIGKSNWSNPYGNFILDEFRIWDVARTQSQIRQNICQKLSGNETGLVLYFNFDTSSGTTVFDLSGNDRHGSLKNMENSDWITSGAPIGDISTYDYNEEYAYSLPGGGRALNFDRFNDYVDLGNRNELKMGNTFTIEAWIYPTPSDNNYYGIIGNQTDINTPNTRAPSLWVANYSNIHYDSYATDNSRCYIDTGAVTSNQWNHVAVVYDSTTLALYGNGISVYSSTSCSGYDLKDIPINYIGKVNDLFQGNIDEVRLWTVARTTSQIQDNMNTKLLGNETGLVAYYRFDSTSGTTLYDSTDNNFDGTLINMDSNSDWVVSGVQLNDANTYAV